MIRSFFIFFFCLSVSWVAGQPQYKNEYLVRDSLISEAMKEEAYLKAINLIEQQFLLIDTYEIYDSLYHYCYNFGRAWWKTGGPEKGIDAANSISNEVKAKDPDILHYLQTLNDLSWLYYETGNVNQCLIIDSTYLSMCLEHEGIPTEKLNIAYYNMGFDYLETGKNQQSLQHFQSSVDVILNSGEKLDKSLSKSYNALGAVQWHLGYLEQAKTSYEESLALIDNDTDPNSRLEQGNILGNMALIMQDNGEIIKAKEYQERFIQIDSEALPLVEDAYMKETALRRMSSAYINLADIYFGLGDYAKSRKLVELAIAERRKLLEPDDPSLASAIEHLAYLEMQSGNYQEAEIKLTEYLTYCQHYFGENSAKTAWAYKGLGYLYNANGEYEKSAFNFNKAIACQTNVGNPGSDPALALMYRERSSLYANTSQMDKALSDLQKSMNIYAASRKEESGIFISLYLDMAEIMINVNKPEEAANYVEQAINVLNPVRNDTKQLSSKSIDELSPHILPRTYYLKAYTTMLNDSSDCGLNNALNDLGKAISYLRTGKQSLLDRESKLLFYDAHRKVFNLASDLSYTLYLRTNEPLWINAFFQFSEENRTILLRSRLNSFSALNFAGIPDSLLAKERELNALLRNVENNPEITRNFVNIEKQYDSLLVIIQEDYPEYYALKYEEKEYLLDDLQAKLITSENNMLIYSFSEKYTYTLFVNKDTSFIIREIKGELENQIASLNNAIIKGDMKLFAAISNMLYKRLIKPVKPFLKSDELIIVPDGDLFFLNFEILQEEGIALDISKMLINNYVISYQLSAGVAMQFSEMKQQKAIGLLTFAPGFSDHQKELYQNSINDTALVDKKYFTYLQQPFAVQTAKNVAGLFAGASYVENEADETTFKKEAKNYGIIHLGTHAEINEKSPLMSHLVLSKNINNDSLDDGYLHAYEIYQMPLRAELAVLTACETGIGKQQSSEGVISLAHSFSYAGCPSIVMSMWNIDEKISSGIVNDFYHHLSDGMPKNKALRQSKLDYLKQTPTELQSPYYWAGLVLLGDTNPVSIESGFDWFTMTSVLIVILALLIYLLVRGNK